MGDTTYVVLFIVFAAPFAFYVLAALFIALWPKKKLHGSYEGKHVLVTGGSQGLGRAIAFQLVAAGANVTILSRSAEKLKIVVDEAQKSATPGRGQIAYQAVDTRDFGAMQYAVAAAESMFGPIDILFPVVGKARTAKLEQLSIEDHKQAMEINYFGTLNTVYAVLPTMRERKQGSIVFITSGAAMTSYIGYAAYSPSKYAVRGLADCLRNELEYSGVTVHIAYPGQMDTPGFAEEQLTKPAECKAIEADDTMHQPEAVAKVILRDLQNGKYNMYCGDLGISILGVLGAGMSPRTNWALDILLFPIGILAGWIVRSTWSSKVRQGTSEPDMTAYQQV
ncbi:3-ketodihydrosphingosine reductase-like [Thraustotheca clavata]|uniref:3-dehydrosphinganine reductase n=1 Tax=Thraustotheca clavata TaxID=74557 RepID=A0A1V9ZGU0_9STRA|nr:3-ketodihydrosphingosine reductase-like [Thraustotheca clavata]